MLNFGGQSFEKYVIILIASLYYMENNSTHIWENLSCKQIIVM